MAGANKIQIGKQEIITMNIDVKRLKEIDNDLTFAVTYRNMVNYTILVVGFYMLFAVYSDVYILAFSNGIGLVIVCMGFRWTSTQIRENLDTIECNKLIGDGK